MNKPRILLVDDEPSNLNLLKEMLTPHGFLLTFAKDGQKTMELLDTVKPDLILLDVLMPKMDGWQVLEQIKSDPRFTHIPVVLQTALKSNEDFQKGLSLGAFYYINKPVLPEILLPIVNAAIDEYLRIKQLTKELTITDEILTLTDEWKIRFRTLEQAASLSKLVSKVCPQPERALLGLIELLTNAVEHGIAQIGYDEKTSLRENNTWHKEVVRRLNLPEHKKQYGTLSLVRSERHIIIDITDPGPGFNWEEYLEFSIDRAMDNHGRGIAMAKATSFDSIQYRGNGNEVKVFINLNES